MRHKIIWDFEIQTDQQIPARKSDVNFIKKKKITYLRLDFDILAAHKNKKN